MTPEETNSAERERERERERITSFSLSKYFRRFFTNQKWIRHAHHDNTVIVSMSNYRYENPYAKIIILALQGLSSGFKFGLGIAAGLATAGLLTVAVSGVMNSFSDGETLTAGKLNTNFNSLKAAIENIPNWTKSGTTAVYNDGFGFLRQPLRLIMIYLTVTHGQPQHLLQTKEVLFRILQLPHNYL